MVARVRYTTLQNNSLSQRRTRSSTKNKYFLCCLYSISIRQQDVPNISYGAARSAGLGRYGLLQRGDKPLESWRHRRKHRTKTKAPVFQREMICSRSTNIVAVAHRPPLATRATPPLSTKPRPEGYRPPAARRPGAGGHDPDPSRPSGRSAGPAVGPDWTLAWHSLWTADGARVKTTDQLTKTQD